jgi:hypothetical protein
LREGRIRFDDDRLRLQGLPGEVVEHRRELVRATTGRDPDADARRVGCASIRVYCFAGRPHPIFPCQRERPAVMSIQSFNIAEISGSDERALKAVEQVEITLR